MKLFYADIESYFYSFMKRDGLGEGSRSNYISWLRFIDKNVGKIDSTITNNLIEQIIENLKTSAEERDVYQSKTDISSFKSALKKYKSFVEIGDYAKETEFEQEKKIEDANELDTTEKEALILARKGQGLFRQRIIRMFDSKCIISGFSKTDILVASHIKPWRYSSNTERLDENNGILFLPTYDKLFDKGYIGFDANGLIVFSALLEENDKNLLTIKANFSYNFNARQLSYLQFHFENIFLR